MRFCKLDIIVLLKICATEKIFGKICLKIIRGTFFSNMWSAVSGGTGGLKVLVGGDIQQKGKLQTYGIAGNKQNSNSHLFCNVEEIQLRLIKPNCFTYLVLLASNNKNI